MRPNRLFWPAVLLLTASEIFGQEKQSKIAISGYVKNMSTFMEIGDTLWYENLTHNRLNLTWFASDQFTAHFDVRTRIIVGDFVGNLQPIYGEIIDGNNDYFNLSANLIDNDDMVFNTMIDRVYLQWNKNKWEIRAGRQRVNWGMNLVWNPNDWFNAYSFFDFDYEERRGSDAIRVKYYSGTTSSIEVAAKMSKDLDRFVAAGMWKINKWDYDFQFLGGVAQGDVAFGTGWAGNLGLAGFKGELTYLKPFTPSEVNDGYDQMFLASMSVDYSFKSSLYLNGSILYNANNPLEPAAGLLSLSSPSTSDFTIRDLSNYRWSTFIQSAYQFSPLVNASVSIMAFPGSNSLFLNPAISVSLSQNMDLGVFGQLYFDEDVLTDKYSSISPRGFLRLKWNF
jgi:hypothetical protein